MDFNPETCYNLLKKDLAYENPILTSDTSISDARKMAILESIFKKLAPRETSSLADRAIDTFLTSNARCQDSFIYPDSIYHSYVIELAKSIIWECFYSGPDQSPRLTYSNIVAVGRPGPGSSAGTRAVDFYNKMFSSKLTYTSEDLLFWYKYYNSDSWRDAESYRFAAFGGELLEGSTLTTVPKNSKTDRTICTEPSLNMFFQLGAGAIIEELLKEHFNIDVHKQPEINKRMARLGSIDGAFSTIDLSNASDTISSKLLQYLIPPKIYALLDNIRSKQTKVRGEFIALNLFSSMGNGFTFPLQTLIFAALVKAVYIAKGLPLKREDDLPNFSVFGDDIICVSKAYHTVTQILGICGFTVNDDKSFNAGYFRESCGGDFFKGHSIRGVYIKKVECPADLYSVFNRLLKWSVLYQIPIFRTLEYVKGLVEFRPVPLHASDDEGIKIPSAFLSNRKRDRNGAIYYNALTTIVNKVSFRESSFGYNPWGHMIAAIGGYIQGTRLTLRSNERRFKVAKRKTPCWDFILGADLTPRDYYNTFTVLLST